MSASVAPAWTKPCGCIRFASLRHLVGTSGRGGLAPDPRYLFSPPCRLCSHRCRRACPPGRRAIHCAARVGWTPTQSSHTVSKERRWVGSVPGSAKMARSSACRWARARCRRYGKGARASKKCRDAQISSIMRPFHPLSKVSVHSRHCVCEARTATSACVQIEICTGRERQAGRHCLTRELAS